MIQSCDSIICPHCKKEIDDSWEYFKTNNYNSQTITCGHCEKEFECAADFQVTYQSWVKKSQ